MKRVNVTLRSNEEILELFKIPQIHGKHTEQSYKLWYENRNIISINHMLYQFYNDLGLCQLC